MNFISVSLKNFKSYPDIEQTLPLNHIGIKLITAHNAAGKTSLIESIIWCLYGKTSQDSVDDVVNRYNKKNCKVNVIFTVGQDEYSVFRYRSHETHGNALYIFKNNENISLKNTADTQQLIQDIIQIPYSALVNSIIFSTEFYTSFFKAKQSERLKILESILSLKEISALYDLNKNKINELDEGINHLEHEKKEKEASLISIIESNTNYIESVKKNLLTLKEEKNNNSIRIIKLKDEIDEYKNVDIEYELGTFKVEENNKKISEEIKLEEKKLINIISLEAFLIEANRKEIEFSSIDIDKELNILQNNKKINDEILQINGFILFKESGIPNVEQIKKEIDKTEKEIVKIDNEIFILNKNVCYVCGHTLNEEENIKILNGRKNELILLQNKLNELKENYKKSNEEKENFLKEIKSFKEKEKQLVSLITKTSYTEEKLNKIKQEKFSISLEKQLKEKERESGLYFNKEILNKINVLKNQIIENRVSKYNEAFLNNLKNEIQKKEKEINELENKNISIDRVAKNIFDKNLVENNEEKIKVLKIEIKEIDKNISFLKNDMLYYQILSTVFSNKESGFKKFFINKMISVFNETINFYLPFFFNKTIYITLDKELTETIEFDERIVSFNSFSSGQKTRVEIATSFALFNLVKVFFSNDTNLIVMDELLDKHIDSDGFDAVIEVINSLSNNNSIFIISHREELKEKFTDKIEIQLEDDKYSKIIF